MSGGAASDRQDACARFLDVVPFSLYPFQEDAILAWAECEGGVLVTAPTGMGKTVVAEAAVFEALATGRRLYYTSPLIALTDQKYRELQEKAVSWGFSADDVGLITGNRKENPDARVRVVVAEILLNHLLSSQETPGDLAGVVMDEFHWFDDPERGIVWELSLALLPPSVRVLLLSATVGNPVEFTLWLKEQFGRSVRLVRTDERKVPLEYHWAEDELLTDQLVSMTSDDDAKCLVPALVFCFSRDECWDVAQRLKGLPLLPAGAKERIEESLPQDEWKQGAGPRLRAMLLRGVGVHHAGVLPRFKEAVEDLFLRKLVPFVICTETLAAGVNLPARSVVLTTLLKGKPGERKLIPASSAHQMFGRAGRPQFDTKGHVFVMAHEDDVRIAKWRKRAEQLDALSKDPKVLRMRKDLERKRPTRRSTEQYWSEGQMKILVQAGPANLHSRSSIPYAVLVSRLTRSDDLQILRDFVRRRFAGAERIEKFAKELDAMLANLAKLGYVDGDLEAGRLRLREGAAELLAFRSVDPLYGAFLARELVPSDRDEKLRAIESVLALPWQVVKRAGPFPRDPGPLQRERIEPQMIAMGVQLVRPEPESEEAYDMFRHLEREEEDRPPEFPEMLKIAFEAELAVPEDVAVQPKWIAGGVLDAEDDFHRFVSSRDLEKNEGIVLRHLLRVAILAGEFHARTEDPDYAEIGRRVTAACRQVDPRYTDRFLQREDESRGVWSGG